MDNGEEIAGLNEDWNFMGANMIELMSGLATFFVVGEALFKGNYGANIPYLLFVWFATTISLSRLRVKFPDENKGVRNYFLTALGFAPPGIPAPSALQATWSGAPVKNLATDPLKKNCEYLTLGLDKVFSYESDEKNEDD